MQVKNGSVVMFQSWKYEHLANKFAGMRHSLVLFTPNDSFEHDYM